VTPAIDAKALSMQMDDSEMAVVSFSSRQQRRKWAVVRRAIVPGLLVLGGLASLVYGTMYHAEPVMEEQETTTTIDVPAAFIPGEFGRDAFAVQPRSNKKTVTRVERVTKNASEPALIRDITVGGVALLDSGQLKRTYSGKGPALCPS
jgi:hypothetical protein